MKLLYLLFFTYISTHCAVKIGIYPFYNKTQNQGIGLGLTESMYAAMKDNPGIVLLERAQLKKLEEEISFSESGLVDPISIQKSGLFKGADYVIYGSIYQDNMFYEVQAFLLHVKDNKNVHLERLVDKDIYKIEEKILITALKEMNVICSVHVEPVPNKAFKEFSMGLYQKEKDEVLKAVEHLKAAIKAYPPYKLAREVLAELKDKARKLLEQQNTALAIWSKVPLFGAGTSCCLAADDGAMLWASFAPSTRSFLLGAISTWITVSSFSHMNDHYDDPSKEKQQHRLNLYWGLGGLAFTSFFLYNGISSKLVERKMDEIEILIGEKKEIIPIAIGVFAGSHTTTPGEKAFYNSLSKRYGSISHSGFGNTHVGIEFLFSRFTVLADFLLFNVEFKETVTESLSIDHEFGYGGICFSYLHHLLPTKRDHFIPYFGGGIIWQMLSHEKHQADSLLDSLDKYYPGADVRCGLKFVVGTDLCLDLAIDYRILYVSPCFEVIDRKYFVGGFNFLWRLSFILP